MFNAILINKSEQGYQATLSKVSEQALPEGDVQIAVTASTLNYKDALAITGKSPVVRQFPMVPGIDLVGEVLSSDSDRFQAGDQVLLNGFGVGETHWGGLAERASLKANGWFDLRPQFQPHKRMPLVTPVKRQC